MKDQGIYIGIGCGAASLISFINLVTICCICYHPTKNKNKGAFYSKMMDEDWKNSNDTYPIIIQYI